MTNEYTPIRFLRISDDIITQDLKPPKLTVTFEGSYKEIIKITFPIGYKMGFFEKSIKNRVYYKGGESDYNIIVEYTNEGKSYINDLIILQTQSGAEFHYIIGEICDLGNKIIIIKKDQFNRSLEENEYDSMGLYKTRIYKYIDNEHIIEKRITDHHLGRSYYHKIINNATLEEIILRDNGSVKQTNIWGITAK